MNVLKAFVNMDKYFYRNNLYFDFDRFPKLKIKLKFNKTYSGVLIYENVKGYNYVDIVIKRNGTNIRTQRNVYTGVKRINLLEQIYKVKAFNSMFVVKVSSNVYENSFKDFLSNAEEQDKFNIYKKITTKIICKESYIFLDKSLLFYNYSNEQELFKLKEVLNIISSNKYLLYNNPSEFYSCFERLVKKLYYNGYINDYIDENTIFIQSATHDCKDSKHSLYIAERTIVLMKLCQIHKEF